MRPFEYLEPASLNEACSMLSELKGDAKIIAGGQSMLPILKQRLIAPRYIISIKHLSDLSYIRVERDRVKIGALTTHRTVETSPLIKETFPILGSMEASLASVQIRNSGTLGGSLCHADPAGDVAPVLLALGARLKTVSVRGTREISIDDFFVDYLETVLEPDELLAEIEVPNLAPMTAATYIREAIRFGDYPILSVAAAVTIDKRGLVKEARIALGAVGKTPVRAKNAEVILVEKKVNAEVLEEVGKAVAKEIEPTSDVIASSEYKRKLANLVTMKAVSQAMMEAKS
jgi:aerobic carbon-monoxide dehydrogenase medium subunit